MFGLSVVDVVVIIVVILVFCWGAWSFLKSLDFSTAEGACISLAVIYYFLGRPIVHQGVFGRNDPLDATSGIVPCFLLGLLATALRGLKRLDDQSGKDQGARSLLDAALTGTAGWYSLYLRPFVVTKKLPVENGAAPRSGSFGAARELFAHGLKEVDFEEKLADAMDMGMCPLIALGNPGEAIGAGRVKSDEANWTDKIVRLMANAEVILVIPSANNGTVWEICHILENRYLPKTCWIRPPGIRDDAWLRICHRMASEDIGLTSFGVIDEPAVFVLDGRDQLVAKRSIKGEWKPGEIYAQIEGAIRAVSPDWNAPSAIRNLRSEPENRASKSPRPVGLKKCPNCQVTVIPTASGECPSCRKPFPSEAETPSSCEAIASRGDVSADAKQPLLPELSGPRPSCLRMLGRAVLFLVVAALFGALCASACLYGLADQWRFRGTRNLPWADVVRYVVVAGVLATISLVCFTVSVTLAGNSASLAIRRLTGRLKRRKSNERG